MIEMAGKQIIPAVVAYTDKLSKTVSDKVSVVPGLKCQYEKQTIARLSELTDIMADKAEELKEEAEKLSGIEDIVEKACAIRDKVLPKMDELRAAADEAEEKTAKEEWPFPTYGDLLFGVR